MKLIVWVENGEKGSSVGEGCAVGAVGYSEIFWDWRTEWNLCYFIYAPGGYTQSEMSDTK